MSAPENPGWWRPEFPFPHGPRVPDEENLVQKGLDICLYPVLFAGRVSRAGHCSRSRGAQQEAPGRRCPPWSPQEVRVAGLWPPRSQPARVGMGRAVPAEGPAHAKASQGHLHMSCVEGGELQRGGANESRAPSSDTQPPELREMRVGCFPTLASVMPTGKLVRSPHVSPPPGTPVIGLGTVPSDFDSQVPDEIAV